MFRFLQMPVSDAVREPKKGVLMPAAGRKTCNNQLEDMQQVRRGGKTVTHSPVIFVS